MRLSLDTKKLSALMMKFRTFLQVQLASLLCAMIHVIMVCYARQDEGGGGGLPLELRFKIGPMTYIFLNNQYSLPNH